MGLFSGKKQLPRSEAAMAEATDLGPITLQLDGHHLTFEDCVWLPDYDAEIPARGDAMEQELVQLRRERRVMKKELDRYSAQTQEMKNLKERWNLLDFKYQLLLDMWTMKSLDSKRDNTSFASASPISKWPRVSRSGGRRLTRSQQLTDCSTTLKLPMSTSINYELGCSVREWHNSRFIALRDLNYCNILYDLHQSPLQTRNEKKSIRFVALHHGYRQRS
ncbi:hypothetical protein CY35_19G067200 [Sphagnum magellanicum]|nr:hypothetical protein CY35_19G067200 [Sphagnum magellanicum]